MELAASNTGTGITVALRLVVAEDVRCVVVAANETAPTGAEVNLGQRSGGASGEGNSGGTVAVSFPGGTLQAFSAFTGLVPNTPYDVYCATTAEVVSDKLGVWTQGHCVEADNS